MTPRDRTRDKHLPRGLYAHRQRFRARAWLSDGEATPRKRPGAVAGWRYFDPPLADAARAFYEWRGEQGPTGEIAASLTAYLESPRFKRLASSTQRTERARVLRLSKVFGHMRHRSLKREHITGYLQTRPLLGGKKDIKRLSAIMSQWESLGLIERNFVPGVLRAWDVPDNVRDRYVTDSELAAALEMAAQAGAKKPSATVVWCVLMMVLFTGRRVSDVRRMMLTDWREDGLHVREGKTGKRVVIERTDALEATVTAVREAMKGRSKVAPLALIPGRDGQPMTEGALNQAWQRLRPLLAAEGIAPFQLRDIRAKHGTDLEQAGRDGARNLGHSSRRVFDLHYNRLPKKIESYR